MTHHTLAISAAIAASAITSSTALADFVSFDMVWEGINGSNASATGSVTIDTSLFYIANGGSYFGFMVDSPFTDFTLTVIDAVAGNGTFTQANGDFEFANWNSSGPLDLSTDLVGQAGFTGVSAGSNDAGLPYMYGTGLIEINRNGVGGSDLLQLTSMTPSTISMVPLPPAAWAGLGMLGVMGVRRRMSR